jgi:hypothetical protein
MGDPTSWQRVYRDHGPGPEHPATEASLSNVLRSMNESADSAVPFKVRVRFGDGTSVLVKPKRTRGPLSSGAA